MPWTRPTFGTCRCITALKRIFEYAGMFQIRTGVHGPEDISPIGMSAAVHLGLAVHNYGIQEFARYSQASIDVFRPGYSFTDGSLRPSDAPGLGVSYDESIAATYEYEPSYLPVNRLEDGTVHDW